MLSALWVTSTSQLMMIVHHLAVDGVSWRILLEDINLGWAQHRDGQSVVLPAAGTSFRRWAELLTALAHDPGVVEHARTWREVSAAPAIFPAVRPDTDTHETAGQLSVSLDVETTRMLLGAVPAAFHTGPQDILLIAFGLALAEFAATDTPIGIDVESHGRHEEIAAGIDLSRPSGGSPPSIRCRCPGVGCAGPMSWPEMRHWARLSRMPRNSFEASLRA